MQQTPSHDQYNPDLLRIIPRASSQLIEIGCSTGSLARAFKALRPHSNYFGVEIEQSYSSIAQQYCDECITLNIEEAEQSFWISHKQRDCWIFGDTLEHLVDPWSILMHIRQIIPINGCIVACIPNAQHWSLQAKLSSGDFRYQDSGLLDRTHLRWFTRQTIIELFTTTGYSIVEMKPRVFNEPDRDRILPIIKNLASAIGADSDVACQDALALQYVIRAIPKVK